MTATDHAGTLALRSLLTSALREFPEAVDWVGLDRTMVEIRLGATGARLRIACTHRSATGHHLFAEPVLVDATGRSRPLPAIEAATLLLETLGAAGGDHAGAEDLIRRLESSFELIRTTLEARRGDLEALIGKTLSFIEAEQGLLAGHAIHPSPKSRDGMTPAEERRYAPELAARFPLRWFAVHPDAFAAGHAPEATAASDWLTEALGTELAPLVAQCRELAFSLLPVHPWQAERMRRDPAIARLVETGRLVDLGEAGEPWFPTSSVRTLYRPDMPFMLKLSLGVGITNSVRINLPKELVRGEDMFRFRRSEAWQSLCRTYPGLHLIPDPASMRVIEGNETVDGLSVSMRENPFRGPEAGRNVSALASLCEHLPERGSRIGALVRRRAARDERRVAEVAVDWFERFLNVCLRPAVVLYLRHGIALEAHQQNLLLEIDEGWPVASHYRDNQGFFHHDRAHAALTELLPGLGESSQSYFAESVVDERVVYYLLVNSVFGVVGTLGREGLALEADLLARVRRELQTLETLEGGRSGFVRLALAPKLLAKGNLRTRLARMDELVGPAETQSVYVEIDNPLVVRLEALADA